MKSDELWEGSIMDRWLDLERPPLQSILVAGTEFRVGASVRLWPLGDADIMDIALKGKTAIIAALEQDYEDRIHVAVTVDDDPGRDLGLSGKPAHRFFFSPEEVELLDSAPGERP